MTKEITKEVTKEAKCQEFKMWIHKWSLEESRAAEDLSCRFI